LILKINRFSLTFSNLAAQKSNIKNKNVSSRLKGTQMKIALFFCKELNELYYRQLSGRSDIFLKKIQNQQKNKDACQAMTSAM
jgi:hypothetical protein